MTYQIIQLKIAYLNVEDGKAVVHGVVSSGMGCGHPDYPGEIFANVFSMRNFITSITVS